MNCLIQERMFTYFYNKFRPVNRMHYIKCGVKFITRIILVAAEGLWHLGSLFYQDTQYSQLGWFTNLLWCDIPLNKAPRTGPYRIWHIYTLCPFSGQEKNTDGSRIGWMISLATVCYCDSVVGKHFFILSLVSAIRISLMASSLSLIFFPALAVDTYNGLPYLHSSVWLGTIAVTQCL